MRLFMHRNGGFLARRLDEAEDFAGAQVVPILYKLRAVLGLNLKVSGVGARDRISGQAFHMFMNIQIGFHIIVTPFGYKCYVAILMIN